MRRCARLAVAAVLLAGCSSDLGAPDPGTKQGDDVLDLWRTEFWIAAALGALVLGLIAWCVVRYRRRPDDDGSLPDQRAGHIPLEIFYTAVPLLIVAGLFAYNLVLSRDVDENPRPDVTIDVVGFQWQWRFDYRGSGVSVLGEVGRIPTMVLPTGQTVRLNLRSADVIHAFYVPGFLMKRDVVPGIVNTITLQPTRTGTYLGHCAEFCGLDHARMNFDVRVVSPAEYQSWLRSQGGRT